jgi:hypothetical protein
LKIVDYEIFWLAKLYHCLPLPPNWKEADYENNDNDS